MNNDLITDLLNNGIYATLKLVFEELGVHAGYTREPMAKATPEVKAGAKRIYENISKSKTEVGIWERGTFLEQVKR